MVGVDLTNSKTSEERRKTRYSNALKCPIAEVKLPIKVASYSYANSLGHSIGESSFHATLIGNFTSAIGRFRAFE